MPKKNEAERLAELTSIERSFWSRSGVVLAGMDEVGRGPLAGPVVAACVVLPPEPLIEYVNDSKKLSERRRELLDAQIRAQAVDISLGWVGPTSLTGSISYRLRNRRLSKLLRECPCR